MAPVARNPRTQAKRSWVPLVLPVKKARDVVVTAPSGWVFGASDALRVRCVCQLPTGSMVLLDKAELPGIFATIKASAAENVDTPTVLLLVSHSIDSLAACTILTRLLEDELVSHKVVPVMDYAELSRVYREQIVDASELRSIRITELPNA